MSNYTHYIPLIPFLSLSVNVCYGIKTRSLTIGPIFNWSLTFSIGHTFDKDALTHAAEKHLSGQS